MKRKKEKEMKKNVKGKKYDGFAIVSFVLPLIILISFLIGYNSLLGGWSDFIGLSIFFLGPIISFFSIISGITALQRIKENKNLKGKYMTIIGIILSIIIICFYIYRIIIAQIERRGFQ